MAKANTHKLTKGFVNSLAPKKNHYIVWDSAVTGFGCRVYKTGRKAYIVQYYTEDGEQKRPTIGTTDILLISEAREKARQILLQLANGIDPFEERKEEKAKPTLKEFSVRYMNEHAIPKKKPSSTKSDISNLRLHILPTLGHKKVHKLDRKDVQRLHSQMCGTPGAANRTLALLSKMMNLAEKWGERDSNSNPCYHIEKYKEKKLGRFIRSEELTRLGQILREVEADAQNMLEKDSEVRIRIIQAIRLLLLTGCRLGEVLTLKWEYIDFSLRVGFLPDSKTGQKTIYFSDAAISVIRSVKRVNGNPYIFAGRFGRGHLHRMGHLWNDIRKKAGVEDLRIHDLRHGYASAGVGMGENLSMVGQLLGHTQTQTTARYAHLATSPLLHTTNRIGDHILESLGISHAEEHQRASQQAQRTTPETLRQGKQLPLQHSGYTQPSSINISWDFEGKNIV